MVILRDFEPNIIFINSIFFLILIFFIYFNFSNFFINNFLKRSLKQKDFLIREKLFLLFILINFCGLRGRWESFRGWPPFILVISTFCWIRVVVRWGIKSYKEIISHLTPTNLFFLRAIGLSFIEFLRNIIRPLTLGIRLCANIIGGHLILDLITEIKVSFFGKLSFSLYEIFVCFIQRLIFSLLILSYLEERR